MTGLPATGPALDLYALLSEAVPEGAGASIRTTLTKKAIETSDERGSTALLGPLSA